MPKLDRQTIFAACALVLAALFVGWLRLNVASQYPPATLDKLIEGTAATPFQYRWLVPFLFRGIVRLTAIDLGELVRWYEALCFAATVLAIAAYGRASGLNPAQSFVAGLAYLLVIPFCFVIQPLSRLYYPYDSASVLFYALGLMAIARNRKLLFLGILGLGLLNRESIVLLFALAAYVWRREWRTRAFGAFVIAGAGLVVATKAAALLMFGDNPGAGALSLDHDIMHTGWPKTLESSRAYTNTMLFSQLDSAIPTLSVFAFLWLPLAVFWRDISQPAVRSSLLLIPGLLLIMFFVGNLNEPRIFCELAPVVLVALAHLGRLRLAAT